MLKKMVSHTHCFQKALCTLFLITGIVIPSPQTAEALTLGEAILDRHDGNSKASVRKVKQKKAPVRDLQALFPYPSFFKSALVYNLSADDTLLDLPAGQVLLAQNVDPVDTNNNGQIDEDEKEQEGFIINFNNVNIIEYIRFISKITKKNFIFDEEELDFKVTIVSEEPTTVDNIMAALLQVLRIRGLALLEQDNSILIHKNAQVHRPAKIVTKETQEMFGESELVTQLFHVVNVDVSQLAEVIRPLLSQASKVEVLVDTKHLIVTDLTTNVAKVAQMIETLDSPSANFEIGQYQVKATPLASLVTLSEKILAPIIKGKQFSMIPHTGSRSIFVVSSPFIVKRTLSVLETLDTTQDQTRIIPFKDLISGKEELELTDEQLGEMGIDISNMTEEEIKELKQKLTEQPTQPEISEPVPPTVGLFEDTGDGVLKWQEDLKDAAKKETSFGIRKIQHRQGDTIATALEQMGQSLTAATNANIDQDLVASLESAQWISSTNAIVFSGTQASIARVEALIDELDIPVRQVFIEMLILETNIDNSLNFGVQWGIRQQQPEFGSGIGYNSPGVSPLPVAMNGLTTTSNVNANILGLGEGLNLGVIGKILTHNGNGYSSLGALVRALHTDENSNVVMNPKIIAEDNTAAEIFVGTNTRFKTDSISNDTGTVITNNFEYRDIGTRLKVTPYLGTNEIITLEIEQEVSREDPASSFTTQTTESLDAGPVTSRNTTTTRVHIPDGYFLIISGMMQDEVTLSKSQIPCLGGLPVMGAAFANQEKQVQKRNTMIFIKPKIIDTCDKITEITQQQEQIWHDKKQFDSSLNYELNTLNDFIFKRKEFK